MNPQVTTSRPSLLTSPLTSASDDGKDNDDGDDVPGSRTVNEAVDDHGVVGTTVAGGNESRPSSGSFMTRSAELDPFAWWPESLVDHTPDMIRLFYRR